MVASNGVETSEKRAKKKQKKLLEQLQSNAERDRSDCNLARALGSVDWHTREQGLQALTIWLTRNKLVEKDLTRIWKALYFCFWHADKSHVQVSRKVLVMHCFVSTVSTFLVSGQVHAHQHCYVA
jgi:hypothetical protein